MKRSGQGHAIDATTGSTRVLGPSSVPLAKGMTVKDSPAAPPPSGDVTNLDKIDPVTGVGSPFRTHGSVDVRGLADGPNAGELLGSRTVRTTSIASSASICRPAPWQPSVLDRRSGIQALVTQDADGHGWDAQADR